MIYRKLGRSGLKLPVISLGLWFNFAGVDNYENAKEMIWTAFENGITHFDLANNYGPPAGSAEETFGQVLDEGFRKHRDEIIVTTKAGYGMWDGPYGDGGSRKYLFASLNQSLKRLRLEYVDVFYHHRPDPETDIKETILALADIVRQGKALYIGLSNYNSEQIIEASEYFDKYDVPYVVTQPQYSMFSRFIESDKLLDTQEKLGAGTVSYQPLQQGLLTNKYINNVPEDSRALKEHCLYLNENDITPERINKVILLNKLAIKRNQTLAQMAIAWSLRDERLTSVIIGASKKEQIIDNIKAIVNMDFTEEELAHIEDVLNE